MTEQDPHAQVKAPPEQSPIDTARHEIPYEYNKQDAVDIAQLFNVVGSELTTVDKLVAGEGNTNIQATKLDVTKVFPERPNQSPQPTAPSPPRMTEPSSAPPPSAPIQPIPTSVVADNSEILNKLNEVSKKVDLLHKVYDNLLDKIVKGSKRVTITVNDKNK